MWMSTEKDKNEKLRQRWKRNQQQNGIRKYRLKYGLYAFIPEAFYLLTMDATSTDYAFNSERAATAVSHIKLFVCTNIFAVAAQKCKSIANVSCGFCIKFSRFHILWPQFHSLSIKWYRIHFVLKEVQFFHINLWTKHSNEFCNTKQRKINNFWMEFLSTHNALKSHTVRKALQHHSYIRFSCASFRKGKSHDLSKIWWIFVIS